MRMASRTRPRSSPLVYSEAMDSVRLWNGRPASDDRARLRGGRRPPPSGRPPGRARGPRRGPGAGDRHERARARGRAGRRRHARADRAAPVDPRQRRAQGPGPRGMLGAGGPRRAARPASPRLGDGRAGTRAGQPLRLTPPAATTSSRNDVSTTSIPPMTRARTSGSAFAERPARTGRTRRDGEEDEPDAADEPGDIVRAARQPGEAARQEQNGRDPPRPPTSAARISAGGWTSASSRARVRARRASPRRPRARPDRARRARRCAGSRRGHRSATSWTVAVDDPPGAEAGFAGRRVGLVVAQRDEQVQRSRVERPARCRSATGRPGVCVCEWTMPQKTSSASSVSMVRRSRSFGSIS